MYYCIVNPSARSGKGKEIWNKLEYKFLEKKLDYRPYLTKGPGDATKIVRNLKTIKDFPKYFVFLKKMTLKIWKIETKVITLPLNYE